MRGRRDTTPIVVYVPIHGGQPVGLHQADIDRFMSKVDRSSGHGPKGKCWPWTGHRQPEGYGTFQVRQRSLLAHRVAFVIENGDIPPGLCVLHECDFPPCCNPACLWSGTKADNNDDRDAKGRTVVAAGEAHPRRSRPERYSRGETHHRAKLTAADVVAIRVATASGTRSYAELAREYGVGEGHISKIVGRKSWSHV